MGFDDVTRQLLDGKNFATVATLNADGSPQTSVVWVARDGDAVIFSSTTGRKKTRNILRDPRVSLTIVDAANPYRTADIQGTAEVVGDPKKELPKLLSHKYLGEDPPPEADEVERVVVRVTAARTTGFRS